MRSAFLPLMLSLSSGCIPYPVYKKLQPEAQMTVRDEMQRPLPDAQVTLISSAYPYGSERSRQTMQTSADGVATFVAKREWRTEMLMIHGAELYFWNWCVEKAGFATYRSRHASAEEFSSEPTIVLREGASTPCPSRP